MNWGLGDRVVKSVDFWLQAHTHQWRGFQLRYTPQVFRLVYMARFSIRF